MTGDHPGEIGSEEETQVINPKALSVPDPASLSWVEKKGWREMATCQERFCCLVLSVSKPQGTVVKTAGAMESKKAGFISYSLYVLSDLGGSCLVDGPQIPQL